MTALPTAIQATDTPAAPISRNAVIGSTFAWDVAIEQLELLPSDQVRVTREYSVSFTGLGEGSSVPAGVEQAGKALFDRLRGAVRKPPR